MRFYVNIDHVATIRQARRTDEPDPVRAAVLVELAGADGITVHLREDRRHIQDRDVRLLAETIRTPLNLEIAATEEMLGIALALRPHQVTLVPEKREEVTTEGGLDLSEADTQDRLRDVIQALEAGGIRSSLFVDPDDSALEISKDLGVTAIELHTGEYAEHGGGQLTRLASAARRGRELGLAVHAGHGLTYENVRPVAAIEEIEELNIGHSIISRAVLTGLDDAVREMRGLLMEGRAS